MWSENMWQVCEQLLSSALPPEPACSFCYCISVGLSMCLPWQYPLSEMLSLTGSPFPLGSAQPFVEDPLPRLFPSSPSIGSYDTIWHPWDLSHFTMLAGPSLCCRMVNLYLFCVSPSRLCCLPGALPGWWTAMTSVSGHSLPPVS